MLCTIYLWDKNHQVKAMETIIIAAILIILVMQRCLSGLRGPIASWMGTQRENNHQHPGFINLLVTGVQELLHRGKGKVQSSANIHAVPSPAWEYIRIVIVFSKRGPMCLTSFIIKKSLYNFIIVISLVFSFISVPLLFALCEGSLILENPFC